MTDEKTILRAHTKLQYVFQTFRRGLLRVIRYPIWILCLLAFLFIYYSQWIFMIMNPVHGLEKISVSLKAVLYAILGLLILLFLIYLIGYIPHSWQYYKDMIRIGFFNAAGEAPFLMCTYKTDVCTVLVFEAKGFPRKAWEDRKADLETALNMRIARISEGKDCRTIQLYVVPPTVALGQDIPFNNRLVPPSDNFVILGVGLLGIVKVDLDKAAHILIGGSTGSGKSVLLRCLVWQMMYRGAKVIVADYKGGVEYNSGWRRGVRVVEKDEDTLAELSSVVEELERRKKDYLAHDVRSLPEYREKVNREFPRIVVACDEVAEMLDKAGKTKERKENIEKIESYLSTIARQGRAFGIHLFLATQRPDANILNGQIKNNMDIRICGKADATLSTIILGDGKADTEIPKDAQGRFIMPDGTLFQGFNFKDPFEPDDKDK